MSMLIKYNEDILGIENIKDPFRLEDTSNVL